MRDYPKPPFKTAQQPRPGSSDAMDPVPDYGEATYKGSGRLADKVAVITGADSGIGRAVALAFAREGADVLVAYLDEEEDAAETRRLVEDAGRRCERAYRVKTGFLKGRARVVWSPPKGLAELPVRRMNKPRHQQLPCDRICCRRPQVADCTVLVVSNSH